MSEPTLDDLLEIQEMLDTASVPKKDRKLAYIGKDGYSYMINLDTKIPQYIVDQMPDWLLFLGGIDG